MPLNGVSKSSILRIDMSQPRRPKLEVGSGAFWA